MSRDGSTRKFKKFEPDDVSHDQVLRIYQEELTKLMVRQDHPAIPGLVQKILLFKSISKNELFEVNNQLRIVHYCENSSSVG